MFRFPCCHISVFYSSSQDLCRARLGDVTLRLYLLIGFPSFSFFLTIYLLKMKFLLNKENAYTSLQRESPRGRRVLFFPVAFSFPLEKHAGLENFKSGRDLSHQSFPVMLPQTFELQSHFVTILKSEFRGKGCRDHLAQIPLFHQVKKQRLKVSGWFAQTTQFSYLSGIISSLFQWFSVRTMCIEDHPLPPPPWKRSSFQSRPDNLIPYNRGNHCSWLNLVWVGKGWEPAFSEPCASLLQGSMWPKQAFL